MNTHSLVRTCGRVIILSATLFGSSVIAETAESITRSPREIVVSPSGSVLYVVEATAERIAVVQPGTGLVQRHVALPGAPGGLAVSPDGNTLYVTRATPDGGIDQGHSSGS